jgi:hypothetical protein
MQCFVLILAILCVPFPALGGDNISATTALAVSNGFKLIVKPQEVGNHFGVGLEKRSAGDVAVLGLTFSTSKNFVKLSLLIRDDYPSKGELINALNPLLTALMENTGNQDFTDMLANLLTARKVDGFFTCGKLRGVCYQRVAFFTPLREIHFVDARQSLD